MFSSHNTATFSNSKSPSETGYEILSFKGVMDKSSVLDSSPGRCSYINCVWANWATSNDNKTVSGAKHLHVKPQIVMAMHTNSWSSLLKVSQVTSSFVFSTCVNVSWIKSNCAVELVPQWTWSNKTTGEVESSRNMWEGFLAAVLKFVYSAAQLKNNLLWHHTSAVGVPKGWLQPQRMHSTAAFTNLVSSCTARAGQHINIYLCH